MQNPQPWAIEFSDEVISYFVDNGAYTGNLLGEIERLRYSPDGLPESNFMKFDAHLIQWTILEHLVYYWRRIHTLVIVAVKPL